MSGKFVKNRPLKFDEWLKKYREEVEGELIKHGLSVPDETAEALAKRVMFMRLPTFKQARILEEQEKERRLHGVDKERGPPGQTDEPTKTNHITATQGIKKAITHTQKLIEYAGRKPTTRSDKKNLANSIKKRRRSLDDALENPYVMFELPLRQPRVDVIELLNKKNHER